MKTFCFTVDDNIRFLKELTQGNYRSLFDHPYLAVYKRLHEQFDLKVQLNLFYRADDFDLSLMTDQYFEQWVENAHWLKLSFHSELENEWPYSNSGYEEVFRDCAKVNNQILRFASAEALAKTTTVHYCSTTAEGVLALKNNGVAGLLGLFGTEEAPMHSYSLDETDADAIRKGQIVYRHGIAFAPIDMVVNTVDREQIKTGLRALLHREQIWIMIHEQYFYDDYRFYQPDFEEKLVEAVSVLCDQGYESKLFEELI